MKMTGAHMKALTVLITLLIPAVAAFAQTAPTSHPSAGQAPANPALPTLWLVGDSTVRNGSGNGGNGQWGWGDRIAKHFDTSKINVVNRARGGRARRSYMVEGVW